MKSSILIISNKIDLHTTSVIDVMNERHIPFFRLNTEALLSDYEFSWRCESGKQPTFYIRDKHAGKTITNEDVLSVWYRRPLNPEELLFKVDEQIDKHNIEEAKMFYSYLMFYLSDYYSIGNHRYDKNANSKLIQHQLAISLGMKVPSTCFTNTKKDLVDFAKDFDSVIIKPIRDYGIWYDADHVYNFYATKVGTKALASQPEEAFSQTVNFSENYVEKKYEVRVTVMGSHIFPCKIDSQIQSEDTGKIDWRQGYDHNLREEMIELPDDVTRFCQEYLRRLHLHFGCFDFIVTPEDEYVFLECNPNGQWGWIEDDLHVPMSEALVDCLVNQLEI